ncbi:isochorismatase family protein [Mucilaginibacter sp. AW1-3]
MITALDEKTALVLIDLQVGITGSATVHPLADVLANAAKLVAAFRQAGQPVVVVNVNPNGAKWTVSRKDQPSMGGGAFKEEWLTIVPEIKTEPGDIFITKHTWSAFYETRLDAELKKKGVTGIVMTGVSTSKGVEGTARSASELGYNVSFAIDAMTDRVAEAHENSIKYIFPAIGEVGTTDAVIEQLT